MSNIKFKFFYCLGLLLVFLNYLHAESRRVEEKIPQEINDFIRKGVQKNTIVLINQKIKKKQAALLKIFKIDPMQYTSDEIPEFVQKTPKTNLLKYTSLYDDIAELVHLKNQLLLYCNYSPT